MDEVIIGRVHRFGDHIDGDKAVQYTGGISKMITAQELVPRCMVGYDPQFPSKVRPGDVIVAGRNFGGERAHPQFYLSLIYSGIAAVIVDSVSRRFFREAINNGLPILLGEGLSQGIEDGDILEVRYRTGEIVDRTTGQRKSAPVLPEQLVTLVEYGGLIPYLKARLKG